MEELIQIGAKVIGIVSAGGEAEARVHTEEVLRRTRTVNQQGELLLYDVDASGNGLDTRIIEALGELTGNVRRDVTLRAWDLDETDGLDPTVHVLDTTALDAEPAEGIQGTDGGRFVSVEPGTRLRYEVRLGRAGVAAEPATGQHRFVPLALRALGDGSVLLDEVVIYVVMAREGATIEP
jgi:hypothetical protein